MFRDKGSQTAVQAQAVPSFEEVSEPNNRVVTKITAFDNWIFAPRITPDGTSILYSSKADASGDSWNIRRIPVAGGPVQELTRGSWTDYWPLGTKDNSRIVFVSNRMSQGMSLCSVASNGTGGIGLVVSSGGTLASPDMAPDGRLAFEVRQQGRKPQIWTTEGGAALTQLCEGEQPRWAPQGASRICFVRRDANGKSRIWSMNADGSSEVKLTDGDGNDMDPTWSPDGTQIAFASNRGQGDQWAFDIYLMNSDGSGITQLTSNGSYDGAPMFAADGSHLYFLSARGGGNLNIWRLQLR